MQRVYDQIARVAPTEATVFLTGESGTGKELVARTVHDLSRRRAQPFLAINCGAISPNLIESEMFGHERGSFTGADKMHRGYFEQANGGTLFLDEITEMPLELQVRLLRVLETRQLMRIGTAVPIEIDVRIIAATNRDPRLAVEAGQAARRPLPPPERVPARDPAAARARGRRRPHRARPGRGDQRRAGRAQRRSRRRRIALLEKPPVARQRARAAQLHPAPRHPRAAGRLEPRCRSRWSGPRPSASPTPSIVLPLGTPLSAADRQLIVSTLDYCGGDKKRAADMLGICVKTLYNRLKEYGSRSDGAHRRLQ